MERDIRLIRVDLEGIECRFVPEGTSLLELSKDFEDRFEYPVVAAKVNNEIKELNFQLEEDSKVRFIDFSDDDGMRIYRRSLFFILIKAVYDLFPERKVTIKHSISKGVYAEVQGETDLTEVEVTEVEARMNELVSMKLPFIKHEMSLDAAKEILIRSERLDRYNALEFRSKPYVTVYSCDGLYDYFYGYMVPHTGYIQSFELMYHSPGLLVRFPERTDPGVLPQYKPQQKLFNIFSEYKNWVKILGVDNVGALNEHVNSGGIGDIIRISEALHEKKIAQIADMVANSTDRKRLVLISGPSSSGKTTFAQRLGIQLRVNGLKPVTISLDDYFVNREQTPRDETGDYDFEALEAIDVELFNLHLASLICGDEVEIPVFSFQRGSREERGRNLCIDDNSILVVEGIHGLNEKLTSTIARENKFKIYVSALTSLSIDDHNRIPSTDTRIIRRITRDNKYRGTSALNTIKRWPSVRRGEDRNIFPFQEEADIMFNSALLYELGVLKTHAEPLLMEIDRSVPEYSEARRLVEFLSNFLPIDPTEIPANSIIREFIGGSCF